MALDLDLLERLDKEIREHLNQGDPADSASPLAQLQSHLLAKLDEIIASVATVRELADECPDLDPEDSRRPRELRNAIDEHLGWPDAESEERGDYVRRMKEVGASLAWRRYPENAPERVGLYEVIDEESPVPERDIVWWDPLDDDCMVSWASVTWFASLRPAPWERHG